MLTICESFVVRLFSKIMFPQQHHISKALGGCGWEVFDLQYIGRGEGLGGGEGNVTFISGGRGPAPVFFIVAKFLPLKAPDQPHMAANMLYCNFFKAGNCGNMQKDNFQ